METWLERSTGVCYFAGNRFTGSCYIDHGSCTSARAIVRFSIQPFGACVCCHSWLSSTRRTVACGNCDRVGNNCSGLVRGALGQKQRDKELVQANTFRKRKRVQGCLKHYNHHDYRERVNVLYKLAAIDAMHLSILVAYRFLFATAFISPITLLAG
nr:WAT1-related protein At1g25270-like [Tanacetum cinerariifolium]